KPAPRPRRWWEQVWTPRWAVGSALAAALLVTLGVWQWTPTGPTPAQAGVMVTSAHTDDPRGTVMVYSTPEQDVAVGWLFGVDQHERAGFRVLRRSRASGVSPACGKLATRYSSRCCATAGCFRSISASASL